LIEGKIVKALRQNIKEIGKTDDRPSLTVMRREWTAKEKAEKLMEEIHVRATSVGGVLEGILRETSERSRWRA
jgi:hypothetical protein